MGYLDKLRKQSGLLTFEKLMCEKMLKKIKPTKTTRHHLVNWMGVLTIYLHLLDNTFNKFTSVFAITGNVTPNFL